MEKRRNLQTIVNVTLEHYNRGVPKSSGQAHAITMSVKKQQRQFLCGALASTAHAQDFDLLPHSSQGRRSQCV